MIRVIDHKKVELTDDEFAMYQKICRSYDRPNFKGEDLFSEHFNSNDDGIITFVLPPSKKYTTMEVFCFLISIMVNQHLRLVHKQTDILVKETKEAIDKLIKNSGRGKGGKKVSENNKG